MHFERHHTLPQTILASLPNRLLKSEADDVDDFDNSTMTDAIVPDPALDMEDIDDDPEAIFGKKPPVSFL